MHIGVIAQGGSVSIVMHEPSSRFGSHGQNARSIGERAGAALQEIARAAVARPREH